MQKSLVYPLQRWLDVEGLFCGVRCLEPDSCLGRYFRPNIFHTGQTLHPNGVHFPNVWPRRYYATGCLFCFPALTRNTPTWRVYDTIWAAVFHITHIRCGASRHVSKSHSHIARPIFFLDRSVVSSYLTNNGPYAAYIFTSNTAD